VWEASFVAVRVLLGEPADEVFASLKSETRAATAILEAHLRAPQRHVRAQALASQIQTVAIALAELTLR
jgi:hypothetical protein